MTTHRYPPEVYREAREGFETHSRALAELGLKSWETIEGLTLGGLKGVAQHWLKWSRMGLHGPTGPEAAAWVLGALAAAKAAAKKRERVQP